MVTLRNVSVFTVILLSSILITAGCTNSVNNNQTQPSNPAQQSNPTQPSGYESFKGYCFSCHKINGQGGNKGPDLSKIGANRSKEWLVKWITNPKAVKPSSRMPGLNLSEKRINDIAEYLATLK